MMPKVIPAQKDPRLRDVLMTGIARRFKAGSSSPWDAR